MVIEGIGIDKYIELMYVEKSVYVKYGRGPIIGNLRPLWSKHLNWASKA
jgi:hypothetical protein